MPGATATGQPAYRPIINVPMTVAMMVATNPAAKSIPASDKMPGLTAMINDIVRNVEKPAMISVFTFVPDARRLNSFSTIA